MRLIIDLVPLFVRRGFGSVVPRLRYRGYHSRVSEKRAKYDLTACGCRDYECLLNQKGKLLVYVVQTS